MNSGTGNYVHIELPLNQGTLGLPADQVKVSLDETVRFASNLIRSRTPRDTGRMASSWDIRVEGGKLVIDNPQPYSGFIEHGTSKIPAFQCASGATSAIEAFFRQRIEDRFRVYLRDAIRQNNQTVYRDNSATGAAIRSLASLLRERAQIPAPTALKTDEGLTIASEVTND